MWVNRFRSPSATTVVSTQVALGDHLACGVFDTVAVDASGPVADRLRSAGQAVALTLPETIDDADGYRPVGDDIKQRPEGRTVLLARTLSPAERRTRLRRRLEDDFDLGYVAPEFAADGSVASLAVGEQQTGLSATLPPDRVAVSIRAAYPPVVSTGDPVEVWTADADSSQLVATGTLRASSETVATLVVDEDDATAFTHGKTYRLTVQPASASDATELVSAIRFADETVTVTTVVADGPLKGEFVEWIPGTVLAIERDEDVIARPAATETVRAGDTVYVLATPETLRHLCSRSLRDPTVDLPPEDTSSG